MRFYLFRVLQTLFLAWFYLASIYADETNVSSTTQEGFKKNDDTKSIDSRSIHSSQNREGKVVEIFIGTGITNVSGTVGYYLTPNWIVEFSAGYGIYTGQYGDLYGGWGGDILDSYSTHGYQYTLRSKNFWTNSFYTYIGPIYQYGKYKENDGEFITGGYSDIKANYYAFGLDLGIGNQWQWKNFTLGADWVGFKWLPIGGYSGTKEEKSCDSFFEPCEYTKNNISGTNSSGAYAFALPTVYLGVSL